MLDRASADPLDPDLLDHVVAGGRSVERWNVRSPGQEPRGTVRVVLLGLEGEGPLVRLPAGQGRLEGLREIWTHVEPGSARAAAEPLDRAADGEVDAERRHVERHGSHRLVRVEDDQRTGFARPRHDRLDVLDPAGLEEHVRDRHEQGPLVDRLDDPLVVRSDDHLRAARRLVEVANRREVALLVDDPAALPFESEAREHDRFGQRHVLVHGDGLRSSPDQPPDLLADGQRQLPPTLFPGADAARVPGPRVLGEALLDGRGHGAQRVVDQVGRLREDRESVAVLEQVAHVPRV